MKRNNWLWEIYGNIKKRLTGLHPIPQFLGLLLLRLVFYVFLYIIIAFVLVGAFCLFYFKLNIENPFRFSLNIFYGLEINYSNSLYYLVVLECFARDLFSLAWVGAVLVYLLTPAKRIFFSKYFIYDKNSVTFRYWILIPKKHYLYDVMIRVLITESKKNNIGRNKISTLWEWESSDQHLSLARGDRYVEINKQNCSGDSFESFSNYLKNAGIADYTITIMIRGTDKRGKVFYSKQTYKGKGKGKNLVENHVFLQTTKSEYLDSIHAFSPPLKDKINANDLKKLPAMRYNYFNKLYKTGAEECLDNAPPPKDVLCEEKVCRLHFFSDAVNILLALFWLDGLGTSHYENELCDEKMKAAAEGGAGC